MASTALQPLYLQIIESSQQPHVAGTMTMSILHMTKLRYKS